MTLRAFVDGDRIVRVSLRELGDDRYEVVVGERRHEVTARRLPSGLVALRFDGRLVLAATAPSGERLQVRVHGHTWTLTPDRGRRAASATAGTGIVTAPMTGTVLRIAVEVGARVEAGATVAIVTAMKMEHRLASDVSGVVREVCASAGQNVEQGAVLVRIEAEEG